MGIPEITVSKILMKDLGMKHVMENFVLQLLLPEQKEHRAAVANGLIQTAVNDPHFLRKVITLKGTEVPYLWHHCPTYNVSYILYFLQ